MSGLSKAAKDGRTREITEITGLTTTDATRLLKQHNWRLDAAIDAFYDNPSAFQTKAAPSAASLATMQRNLEDAWARFSGGSDTLDFDGTTAYCEALDLDPGDPVMLALAHMLEAPTMGHFAKKQWIQGWRNVKSDTIEKQRAYIDSALRPSMSDKDSFRRVYAFTFDYAKAEGQKSLQFEIASELWKMLIPLDPASTFSDEHLTSWLDFLREHGSRAVSRDTWNLFLEFTRTIDDKFENYDENAAWPSVIDDFVDHVKRKSS